MTTEKLLKNSVTYLISGCIIGIILVLGLEYEYLTTYISNLSHNLNPTGVSITFVIRSFVGHAIFIILIWCIGFIPKFMWLQYTTILYRGIALGFTTWFLIDNYALTGILYAIVLYTPQTIVILCTYFFLIKSSVKYNEKYNNTEYLLELLLASSIIFLISMYEAFILPRLILFIF